MWAGDRIFLELLDTRAEPFDLVLEYEGEALRSAALDGIPLKI
jgi:hypothetical protein